MMVKVAAEQSNRNNLLKIVTKPILFSSLISQLPEFDHVFFGDELLVDQANYHSPKIGIKKGSKIGLIIGPAGGFSLIEHQQLKKRGVGIKLANTILKSETAAISLVNYCYFLKQHYG